MVQLSFATLQTNREKPGPAAVSQHTALSCFSWTDAQGGAQRSLRLSTEARPARTTMAPASQDVCGHLPGFPGSCACVCVCVRVCVCACVWSCVMQAVVHRTTRTLSPSISGLWWLVEERCLGLSVTTPFPWLGPQEVKLEGRRHWAVGTTLCPALLTKMYSTPHPRNCFRSSSPLPQQASWLSGWLGWCLHSSVSILKEWRSCRSFRPQTQPKLGSGYLPQYAK
jgi:hypothetical protein